MTEQKKQRTKREAIVCCLSCGYTDSAFVMILEDDTMSGLCTCPKCSNKAYTCNLRGVFNFMQAVTKEIVSLKNSVFELEAASDTEER